MAEFKFRTLFSMCNDWNYYSCFLSHYWVQVTNEVINGITNLVVLNFDTANEGNTNHQEGGLGMPFVLDMEDLMVGSQVNLGTCSHKSYFQKYRCIGFHTEGVLEEFLSCAQPWVHRSDKRTYLLPYTCFADSNLEVLVRNRDRYPIPCTRLIEDQSDEDIQWGRNSVHRLIHSDKLLYSHRKLLHQLLTYDPSNHILFRFPSLVELLKTGHCLAIWEVDL